jgi:NAD(P) transhydrogenase subunit alpha
VIVDMAVESGGNVECARLGEAVNIGGVSVLGFANLPGRVAVTASQMYANNLANLVAHFWNKTAKTFTLDPADPLLAACLVTHGGAICHPSLQNP